MEIKVEKILQNKNIGYKLIKLSEAAFSVSDVINNSGGTINPNEICKTIILRGKKSGKKFAVLLRGIDRLDFSKAKKIFGEEMAIATAEEVLEASGVEPGAVCPFLLNVALFIDNKVLDLETVNCGSGDHLYGIEFKLKDLLNNLDHQTIDISKTL